MEQLEKEGQLNCLHCDKKIDAAESLAMEEAGVDPYCSVYCANIAGGVPLPYSGGALVFDKWMNNNK